MFNPLKGMITQGAILGCSRILLRKTETNQLYNIYSHIYVQLETFIYLCIKNWNLTQWN